MVAASSVGISFMYVSISIRRFGAYILIVLSGKLLVVCTLMSRAQSTRGSSCGCVVPIVATYYMCLNIYVYIYY